MSSPGYHMKHMFEEVMETFPVSLCGHIKKTGEKSHSEKPRGPDLGEWEMCLWKAELQSCGF